MTITSFRRVHRDASAVASCSTKRTGTSIITATAVPCRSRAGWKRQRCTAVDGGTLELRHRRTTRDVARHPPVAIDHHLEHDLALDAGEAGAARVLRHDAGHQDRRASRRRRAAARRAGAADATAVDAVGRAAGSFAVAIRRRRSAFPSPALRPRRAARPPRRSAGGGASGCATFASRRRPASASRPSASARTGFGGTTGSGGTGTGGTALATVASPSSHAARRRRRRRGIDVDELSRAGRPAAPARRARTPSPAPEQHQRVHREREPPKEIADTSRTRAHASLTRICR